MTTVFNIFFTLEDGYPIAPQSSLFQTKQTHLFQPSVAFLNLLVVSLLLSALWVVCIFS